jgi:hypothetical protein
MNELHTVFEITGGGIPGSVLFGMAVGIGAMIAGMVRLVRRWRMEAGWRKMFDHVFLIAFGAIWLAVTWPLWNLATSDVDRLVQIQRSGQSEVTEGTVHVTHMQPLHGHAAGDKIIVGDRQFEINYFLATPGYRQTIAHGGALREGVYARLHHYDGVIIKVEVRPDAASH